MKAMFDKEMAAAEARKTYEERGKWKAQEGKAMSAMLDHQIEAQRIASSGGPTWNKSTRIQVSTNNARPNISSTH